MRIDLSATIAGIDYPDEIWGWLEVLGDAIAASDTEARVQEKAFVADTPYKRVLLGSVHSHLSGLKAVYTLLRTELVSQAAGQARLLCEGMITLRYIAEEPELRSAAFFGYATIEAFEAADAMIKWESATAEPIPMSRLVEIRDQLRPDYELTRKRYESLDRKGKLRRYKNWSDRSIATMAQVSPKTTRLYDLIYRQLSAYVHGSPWSFRHIPAYSPGNYDVNVVLADIAQVTLGTLAVWQVFAEFVESDLGWNMSRALDGVSQKVAVLTKVGRVSS